MEMVDILSVQKLGFQLEIENWTHFFQQPDLGLGWDATLRVNRPEKTKPPPGEDFLILPSGYYYEI